MAVHHATATGHNFEPCPKCRSCLVCYLTCTGWSRHIYAQPPPPSTSVSSWAREHRHRDDPAELLVYWGYEALDHE